MPKDGEIQREILENARESGEALFIYVDEHRLYLPKSVRAKLDEFQKTFQRTWRDYVFSQTYDHTVDYEAFMHMRRGFDTITTKIPELRKVIEQEFHKILYDDREKF
jgi:hypothetical protein